MLKVNNELCDVCGSCVAVCPVDAITINEFSTTIDNNTCVECMKCVIVCPVKAIKEVNDNA